MLLKRIHTLSTLVFQEMHRRRSYEWMKSAMTVTAAAASPIILLDLRPELTYLSLVIPPTLTMPTYDKISVR